MARAKEESASKKTSTPSSSAKPGHKQQSIAGFFKKQPAATPSSATPAKRLLDSKASKPASDIGDASSILASSPPTAAGASPQSSVIEGRGKENGEPFVVDASRNLTNLLLETPGTLYSSPSRKAKKQVNYAESDDDEDEVFKPLSGNRRAAKRRRISVKDDDSEDEFDLDAGTHAAMVESDEGVYCSYSLTESTCDHASVMPSTVQQALARLRCLSNSKLTSSFQTWMISS